MTNGHLQKIRVFRRVGVAARLLGFALVIAGPVFFSLGRSPSSAAAELQPNRLVENSFVSIAVLQASPVEEQLSVGTSGMLRSLTQSVRRMGRVMSVAAARWQMWIGGALAFAALVLVAPVLDSSLLETWRREGLRAFLRSGLAAMAVYVRLLRDARAPVLGKMLLVFAVVYGVSGLDILPDRQGFPKGIVDDLVLVVLASRSFMRMCPDGLVEEHALVVARRQRVG